MGDNRWHESDQWPLVGTRDSVLHLDGAAPGAGLLRWTAATRAGRRVLVSDPAHPIVDPYAEQAGAHDYRSLGAAPGAIVFETAPLAADLRVVGRIRAELFVDIDAPDADIWVKFLDVAPDGTAWNVMSAGLDVQRLSEAGGHRHLPGPGVHRVVLDQLMTGNTFARGHRLRIVVLPSFMPTFSRNLQTGARETESATTRTARIAIRSGPDHPSRLTLPVLPDR
jgi:hypothetical protein